jgi:hexokinase
MIFNIETGGYKHFRQGVIDKEFDSTTIDPGKACFEKMVSGKYQGGLVLTAIKKAALTELFSSGFTKQLKNQDALDSAEIDKFIGAPFGDGQLSHLCRNENDARVIYYLIDNIIERAARLVMIQLMSIMILTSSGKDPLKPVCITAEGSAFYHSRLFRDKLSYCIQRYMCKGKKLYGKFVNVKESTLIGAAIAVLAN